LQQAVAEIPGPFETERIIALDKVLAFVDKSDRRRTFPG
jgi:hypothetical protein